MSVTQRNLLISVFMFAFLLFASQTRVFATTGGYLEEDRFSKYTVAVTYDVDNSCDYERNLFRLAFPVMSDNFNQDDPSSYYDGTQAEISAFNIAKTAGKGKVLKTTAGMVPTGIRYFIQGDALHISKYYIKKLDILVNQPIEELHMPQKVTLWEGEFGMKVAHTGFDPNTGDPWEANSYLSLSENGPVFSEWAPYPEGLGSNKKQESNLENCAVDQYGGLKILGITDLTAPEEISVSEDNKVLSSEFSAGILYDTFGSSWPCQRFDISTDRDDKNISIEYDSNSKKWYLVVPPSANDSEDYDVVISQHTIKGTDFPTSATVRVKTFDYNYTFKDENGNTIGIMTADYGESVPTPDNSHTWVCDEYADWRNTKDGPQERVVYATELLPGKGTKENPYLIQTADDWNKFRTRTNHDTTKGEYYRLENDITVTSTIGIAEKPFEGVFDGNGKTLTIDYSNNDDEHTAPFAYTKDATISNLTVAGKIQGSGAKASGILGDNEGSTLVDHCNVQATIEGKDYVGGISVGAGGNLEISNCTFTGKINGRKDCGGFVALGTNTLVLKNCIFNPMSGSSIRSGATFVNKEYAALENCGYYTALGTPQGTFIATFANGSGTKADPYIIASSGDWDRLQYMTSVGATSGIYFKMSNDLTVTTVIGSEQQSFEGIFDGAGKTLILDYTADNIKGSVAPFAYTSNATIMNLNVNGHIKCSNGHAAGVIGENNNWTLIYNCTVSATIEGGNCIGGFSVGAGGTLKIENCLFDGKINAGSDCGGFVAWGTDTLVLRNCVFDPVSGSSIKSGATFANKAYDTLDNCVYYTALGTPQGDQAPEVYQQMVTSAKKLTVGNFKVKAKKGGKVALSWKKNKNADGYQIKYSKNKKFNKSVKSIKVNKTNAKKVLKKLKPRKNLYVKIRTYKNIKNPANGKTTVVYGKWSKAKMIKIK